MLGNGDCRKLTITISSIFNAWTKKSSLTQLARFPQSVNSKAQMPACTFPAICEFANNNDVMVEREEAAATTAAQIRAAQ